MPTWMKAIDMALKNWALHGFRKGCIESVIVKAEVESAWHEGVPTAEALGYFQRRLAHYSNFSAAQAAA